MTEGKLFQGIYKEQMPLLVKEGYTPLTSKDIMQRRIQALQSGNQDEINHWLNNYYDTSTGLAYHKGNLVVVPDSELLRDINPKSNINNGALVLTPEQYQKLSKKYEAVKRDEVITEESLTKGQAKRHRVWQKLAHDDQKLLNEYVDLIFAKAKEVHNCDKNMGIYLLGDQKVPLIRAWYLGDLDSRSDADVRDDLDSSDARLFGVRAENLEALLGSTAVKLGIINPQELKNMFKLYSTAKQMTQQ